MYDIDTMFNLSKHTLNAIRKADISVTANNDSCQKIIEDNDNILIWPLFRTKAKDFHKVQQETLRFHVVKFLDAVETIRKTSAILKTSFQPIVIFPLAISDYKWVFAKLSLVDDKIQLRIVDLLGLIIKPDTAEFMQLMPLDVIGASGKACEITFDDQYGTVSLEPVYSGAVVFNLLTQYFTTGQSLLMTQLINLDVVQRLINEQFAVLMSEQMAEPVHEVLPQGVVREHGQLINTYYQYTENNISACLEAILAAANLRIGAYGVIRNAESSAPHRVNGYLMAISGLLQIGASKVEIEVKLNTFVDLVHDLLGANVAPEKYVICFPISINRNHWSTGTLTIQTVASADTKVITEAMLMVHDTLCPNDQVKDYANRLFTAIQEKLHQKALVQDKAIGFVNVMPASTQPDTTSCGVLTVLALEACVFRKPLRLNATYTIDEIVRLRAEHLALLKETGFPNEQLQNQQDVRLEQKPKTASLANEEIVAALKEYLELHQDEKSEFERRAKAFLEAKAVQDWSDNNDEHSFEKLKVLNNTETDEQILELMLRISSVADPEGAMRAATANIKEWFKQRMETGNKVPFHDILFAEKLYQGELEWNTESRVDMRSTLLAILETIYLPVPESTEALQQAQDVIETDEEYMSEEEDLIKDQVVEIDGYRFEGALSSDYTFFRGLEIITINELKFTYDGDFEDYHRAIGGEEINPVPELGISTSYAGEYKHENGKLDSGTIVCIIGGPVQIAKESPMAADSYVLFEGEIIEGYAQGPGKLSLVTLDKMKNTCSTLLLETSFSKGIPTLNELTRAYIEADPKLVAALEHYMQNNTDFRMHVNPETEQTINNLREAAERSIQRPALVLAASSARTFTPYRDGKKKRTESGASTELGAVFPSVSEEPDVVVAEDEEDTAQTMLALHKYDNRL